MATINLFSFPIFLENNTCVGEKKSALGTCVQLCPVTQPQSFVNSLSNNAMLLFKKYLY